MADKKYKKPMMVRIDRDFSKDSQRLYRHEHQRDAYIQQCARTWMKIMNVSPKEFWTAGVPQALFDTLQSFEIGAAKAAAVAFLELHGCEVREVK